MKKRSFRLSDSKPDAKQDVERESRDWWNGVWMDVRYGARLLRRSPIFALVAVLSIAGGLAAGTAIFAFTNALLYRPLGVGDGQNLYRIYTSDGSGRSLYSSSSYLDYESFHAAKSIFASTC